MTQGSLIRLMLRERQPAVMVLQMLRTIEASERHEFWADTFSYSTVPMDSVVGHRQVTDAYLAHLARERDGRLATFDAGLASAHQDIAELVPVS